MHTGVRNIVQGVLLGHPIHTISCIITPLPTGPPQKWKLPDGRGYVQDNPAALSPCQYG
jgi:hypothetical protein